MGASAIEQIHLPKCLCESGIKPTKSQISKEDWTFKLARSTYAQRHPGITANSPSPRAWVSLRAPALPTAEQPRCFPRALPFHRLLVILLNPASSNLLPDTFCPFQS